MNAGTNGGNVTLRATPQQSGKLIFASNNEKIWLVLRPTVGSIDEAADRSISTTCWGAEMADTIRVLVTLAEHGDRQLVESALEQRRLARGRRLRRPPRRLAQRSSSSRATS